MGKQTELEGTRNHISAGTTITGDIETTGDIRLDGKLVGTIQSKGKVVIGEGGKLEGEILCTNANISGSVKGKARKQLLLALAEGEIDILVGTHALLEDKVIFKVKDFGMGIPQKAQEKLFQPFFRANNVGSIQGTGIGLVVIKEFVTIHGGTVSVESVEHQGSTFTVVLPIEKENYDS